MPGVVLNIQLPSEPVLSAEKLIEVTGRTQVNKQISWLKDRGWMFELDANGSVLVGSFYAHMRLAGLDPASVCVPTIPTGFDFAATR
jgi:hypothetical protein